MSRLLSYLMNTTALREGEGGGGGAGEGEGEGGGTQTTTVAERPTWAKNDAYWNDEAKAVNADTLSADLDELATIRSERAERAKGVPEKPEGYEVKLPDSLKLPEKYELPFDKDDPLLARFREIAKQRGYTQQEFSELLGLRVQMDLDENAYLEGLVVEERKKLGESADTRITGVAQALEAAIGAEKARALFGGNVFSAVQVEALEDLLKLADGRTMPEHNGNGRKGAPTGMTQEEWDKLGQAEKMNFHRRAAA